MVAGQSGAFPATDWTLISAAREAGEPAQRAKAKLFELYWYPVFAFLRRGGWARSADEARELTHDFFLQRFYDSNDLDAPDARKGRFHNWMMQALRRFVLNHRKYTFAGIRDPRKLVLIDGLGAEERLALEARTNVDAATLFEHDLAVAVLNSALTLLERESTARGEADWYRAAAACLLCEDDQGRAKVAARFGLSVGAVRTRLARMRHRLRALVKHEIAPNASEREVEEEFAWLRAAVCARHFDAATLRARAVRNRESSRRGKC